MYSYALYIAYVVLIALILVWYKWSKKYESIKKLPGPPSHPIFGNMFDLNGSIHDMFGMLVTLNEKYGPLVKVWSNPFKPTLITSDPRYIEILLSSYTHLDKSTVYKIFHAFIGQSLVTSKAELWKKQRKMVNPAFHTKLLDESIAVFEEHGNKFIEILRKQIGKPSVDVVPFVDVFALDVICDSVMRIKTDFQTVADLAYIDARSSFLHIMMNRMYSYIRQQDFIFKFTQAYQEQQRSVKVLKSFSKKIINTRRAERAACETVYEYRQALLDLLLNNNELTDDEIMEHIDTFVVAGHDTPASAISFAMYEIARRPNIQNKILNEIVSIMGKDKDPVIAVQDMQEMKYLDCVIKETLRLYTPLPFFDRQTEVDLNLDDVYIPKGTNMSICSYHLHHNAEYFPDPYNYNPDRFLPENAENIKPYTYIPFSAGPRNCIGKAFAMLEMKSVLAKIVRNFKLSPSIPHHEPKLTSEFVLRTTNGLPIRLESREF